MGLADIRRIASDFVAGRLDGRHAAIEIVEAADRHPAVTELGDMCRRLGSRGAAHYDLGGGRYPGLRKA